MNAVCVIPARLESQRLPRKLLRVVQGKCLVEYSYQNARRAKKPSRVLVACDHQDLIDAVRSFGG